MEVPDIKCYTLTEPGQIPQFWEWFTNRQRGTEYIACDTETGAGTPNGNPLRIFEPGFHVRMMQFGDQNQGWAIPMDGWERLVKGCFDWMESHRVNHLWHNGFVYDATALEVAHGIKLDPTLMIDTQIIAGLIGNAGDSRRLKDCAEREFGGWAGAGSRILKDGMKAQGWNWTTVPFEWQPYPVYGVIDTVIGAKLYEKWRDEFAPFRHLHDVEIAVAQATNRATINGLAVDGAYLKEQVAIWRAKEQELLDRCKAMGWGSPSRDAEVLRVLQEANVLDEKILTNGGAISVNKKQLVGAAAKHPLAGLVLEYRWAHRVAETYLGKLWGLIGHSTGIGRVHPSIWSMEARTHRMSVSDPPAQQFPASDPTVRNAIVPRESDHVLVTADYGQIESRIWASANNDQVMLRHLNEADRTGDDFFVLMARELFNEPGFTKADPRRKPIKNVTYATIFDAGDEKIAEMVGMPLKTLQPIMWKMRDLYPSFKDKGRSMIEYLGSDREGQIYTPTGRRFRVNNYHELRKLPNYRVQGGAAEVLKEALLRCVAAGMLPYFCLPVHDELVWSVPKTEAEDFAQELKVIMDSVVDPAETGVAVTASPGIGSRWSELKD